MRSKVYRVKLILLSVFIILSGSLMTLSAENSRIYSNEDKSVQVAVEKQAINDEVSLNTLRVLENENIILDFVEVNGIILNLEEGMVTFEAKQNESTLVNVNYVRTVSLEPKTKNERIISRPENFNFNIEGQSYDIQNESDDETLIKYDEENESHDIPLEALITISFDKNGNRILSGIPTREDLDFYLKDNEAISVDNETGVVLIVDAKEEITKKNDAFATDNVSMGKKVVPVGDTVTVTWRENRSYYWQLWGGISELFVNGLRSYCLEPSVLERVATGSAYSTNLDILDGVKVHPDGRLAFKPSIKQKKNLEIIANYGYQYPGHNTSKFEWATKKLVWNEMGWDVDGGPNVDKEVKIITDLMNTHNNRLSFDGTTMEVKQNQSVELTEVGLENFEINSKLTQGIEVISFHNDTLIIRVLEDNASLVLDKIKGAQKGASFVYTDGESQKVALLRLADPISSGIKFKVSVHKQRIKKTGENGVPLAGHVFRLSYSKELDSEGLLKEGVDVVTDASGLSDFQEFADVGKTVYVQEIKASKPYIRDLKLYEFIVKSGAIDTLTISNEKANGKIRIHKVDADGHTNIKGAIFEVRDLSGNLVTTITSNNEGLAETGLIGLGKYVATEIFVPAPYVIDKTPIHFEISYVDQTTPVVTKSHFHKNKKALGKIEIIKKSNHGELLNGVKFKIFDHKSELIEIITTDESGKAVSSNLSLGQYFVEEVETLEGFILDGKRIEVTLEYINQTTEVAIQTISIQNKHQRGNVILHKLEDDWDEIFVENNAAPLEGAKIDLYARENIYEGKTLIYSKNQKVGTAVSDKKGKVEFSDLALGKYYAKESKSPEGYVLFEGEWMVDVKYDWNNPSKPIISNELKITNQVIHGKAGLIKTDGGDKLLPGTIFGVFTSEGLKIDELISDRYGMVVSPSLRYGKYYFQEIKPPLGFWLDAEKIHFEITNHESIQFVTKSNKPIEAKLKVRKIDSETLAPLEGVGFKILDEKGMVVTLKFQEGSEIVEKNEWFTNADGIFVLESYLPYGAYTLVESTTPKGYIPIDPISFKIDENQEFLSLEIIGTVLDIGDIGNSKMYSDLRIKKVDALSGESIPNTKFEVYDQQMDLVDSVVTNNEGHAILSRLEYGFYYVVEVEVPFPYIIINDERMQKIFIDKDAELFELEFLNFATMIKIVKKDEVTGMPIEGTRFNLESPSGEILKSLTTNGKGEAQIEGLGLGDYKIKESYVPYPYSLGNNSVFAVTLNKENPTVNLEVYNDKVKGELLVKKRDEKSATLLSNVKFSLFETVKGFPSDDLKLSYEELVILQPLQSGFTDQNGLIRFQNLDIEKQYYLVEMEAPFGYEISKEVTVVDFGEVDCMSNSVTLEKEFTNTRKKVIIKAIKKDAVTRKMIESKEVEFILRDEEGIIVETLMKDDNGVHFWQVDALGVYYLFENVAPKDYILSDEIVEIDTRVPNSEGVYSVEFYNMPAPAPAKIILPNTGISNLATFKLALSLVFLGISILLARLRICESDIENKSRERLIDVRAERVKTTKRMIRFFKCGQSNKEKPPIG